METTAKTKGKGFAKKGKKSGGRNEKPEHEVKDVYQIFTDLILEKLEQGVIPWKQPWSEMGMPSNYLTRKPYHGINLWILLSFRHEYPFYLTFKQAESLGGKIKKGSKGIPVCYWNFVYRHTETGKVIPPQLVPVYPPESLVKSCFLKEYKVFPIEQIEGVEWNLPEMKTGEEMPLNERCEQVFEEMLNPPKVVHLEDQAYYHPRIDVINLPPKNRFPEPHWYYGVLFHELIHSTGHQKRLNRPEVSGVVSFASEAYSKEELVAEMGSGFLCNHTGILRKELLENSAAYIQNWIAMLKNDKNLLLEAASKAQKAVDYILITCPF